MVAWKSKLGEQQATGFLSSIYMQRAWPKSGEIDIAVSRGDNYTYAAGGNTTGSVVVRLHLGECRATGADVETV